MPSITIAFGIVLMALGLVGYFGTGTTSLTALIPSVFGIVLFVLGVIAQDEQARKHAMHAAAAVGLLGFLGTIPGLLALPDLLGGRAVPRPGAATAQATMAILLAIFVGLCVKSFIDARRARRA